MSFPSLTTIPVQQCGFWDSFLAGFKVVIYWQMRKFQKGKIKNKEGIRHSSHYGAGENHKISWYMYVKSFVPNRVAFPLLCSDSQMPLHLTPNFLLDRFS